MDRLANAGEIGGRTVQIVESGEVEVAGYPVTALADGAVRVRTRLSIVSPGTEMTFYGRDASNVWLRSHWNPDLRLFEQGAPAQDYPIVFGYRAAGEVIESRSADLPVGARVWGNWRHTELLAMPASKAASQLVPDGMTWDDAADVGQMGPICVNACLFGEGEERGHPAVVYGAGPIGLITAQVVRANGADPVYVVDRVPERLDIAASLGLAIVPADVPDAAAWLKTRHGPDGVPVVWECTGATGGLHQAIRVARRLGTVVAVGFYQGEASGLHLGDEFHHNAIRIVSAQIGNPHPPYDRALLQRRTLDLVLAGDLVLGGLPRLTLPVERVADAFAALKTPAHVLQVALAYD